MLRGVMVSTLASYAEGRGSIPLGDRSTVSFSDAISQV